MKTQKYSKLYVILVALSVVSMLVSNIGAFKQNSILSWSVPGGTMVFVITYIISDIFSEVYGYKASRFVCWVSFALNLFAVLMLQVAIWWPAPEWFEFSAEFELVLGQTPRVLFAGLAAYVLGDWMNDLVFRKLRDRHGAGKKFALRAVVSSFCGEAIDSTIFTVLAFAGVMPLAEIVSTIVTLVLLKTGYEVLILPVTTYCTKKVREYEIRVNGEV